jgi:prepilin-type N-terminal cleavage/methylation domain-containing protein
MLARIRQSAQKENDGGFTLIELLVVMIIIGVLAAIAIPVFLSQRQKARDTAAKSDVSTLGKEIATYFVDNTAAPSNVAIVSGRYQVNGVDVGKPSSNVQIVTSYGAAARTTGTSATVTGMTASTWCVAVVDTTAGTGSTATVYKYSAQNGLETGQCTSATAP